LWSVADGPTALLMREFYGVRGHSSLGKAQALRAAQLALLTGNLHEGELPHELKRGATAEPLEDSALSPLFVPTRQRPFEHPYYWAAFLLMGGWS